MMALQMLDQEDFVEIREPYFSDDDLLNMSSDGEEEQQHSASQCNQNASGENMSRLLSPASLVQMATVRLSLPCTFCCLFFRYPLVLRCVF